MFSTVFCMCRKTSTSRLMFNRCASSSRVKWNSPASSSLSNCSSKSSTHDDGSQPPLTLSSSERKKPRYTRPQRKEADSRAATCLVTERCRRIFLQATNIATCLWSCWRRLHLQSRAASFDWRRYAVTLLSAKGQLLQPLGVIRGRTIRAFIPAVLLILSLCHCDSTFLFHDFEVIRFTSRQWRSHTRTVVRECFKGDEASQWKRPKFDPSPHQNPLTDLHQNWHAWLCPGYHVACKILWRSVQGFHKLRHVSPAIAFINYVHK